MKTVFRVLLPGFMAGSLLLAAVPAAADAPQEKTAEPTKSPGVEAEHAKGKAEHAAKKGEEHVAKKGEHAAKKGEHAAKKGEHAAKKGEEHATEKGEHVAEKGEHTAKGEAQKLTPRQREEQLYARRMKMLQEKKAKAESAKNEKQVSNIEKQMTQEQKRHEARMTQLDKKAATTKPAPTPAEQPQMPSESK